MFNSIILSLDLPNNDSPSVETLEQNIEAFLAIAVIVILVVMLLFGETILSAIFKVRFGKQKEYNSPNVLSAYLYLAAEMLRADRVDAREKQIYIRDYAGKYFPDNLDDFKFDFNQAIKEKVPSEKITRWLLIKATRDQRLQLIYFLAGLSMVDGSMNRREIALLRKYCTELDLTQKDFDAVIAMYTQRQRRQQSRSSSSSSSYKSTASTKKTALQISCKVLGVSEHASMDEIKKAYRTLVKKHHPDRFATESEHEQKLAQERFLEIQKAYETIEKLK